ncbi:thiol-disulfide oxidoreductase ResA [Thalassobacillus sp. CUG 92003]|uniref:thiol-disulfide oxidoreductase ResA n=1 Tax=Thalassobacillus sp. CUG 92003 TaxID=2736641 RepID=UPI0015E6E5B7|nr:thiol-disulfide oxidoreductase ResA [Thalassobacillus sp. CUG 92003]
MQKKKRRLIFRTVLLTIMAGLVTYALFANFTNDDPVVAEGEQAPNFQLTEFGTDESKELKDFEGKGVMLNFWATYCEPCKDEMPHMEKLYEEYEDKGVEIVAVNLDSTNLVVKRFLEKYDISFPILHDKNGQVMDLYKVGNIPSSLFINAEGEVVKRVDRQLTLDKLEGYLKQIQPDA